MAVEVEGIGFGAELTADQIHKGMAVIAIWEFTRPDGSILDETFIVGEVSSNQTDTVGDRGYVHVTPYSLSDRKTAPTAVFNLEPHQAVHWEEWTTSKVTVHSIGRILTHETAKSLQLVA